MNSAQMNLQQIMNVERGGIQQFIDRFVSLKKQIDKHPTQVTEDRGEVIANITLAMRHLEDAKMRMGKVIQAVEGVSVYDTPASNPLIGMVGGNTGTGGNSTDNPTVTVSE